MNEMDILKSFLIHVIHLYSHNYEFSPSWLKYDYWKFTIEKVTFFRLFMKLLSIFIDLM